MSDWINSSLVVFLLLIIGAFINFAGWAVISVRPSSLEKLEDDRPKAANRLRTLLEDTGRLTTSLQLAVTLIWFLVLIASTDRLGSRLQSAITGGFGNSFVAENSYFFSMLSVSIIALMVIFLFGEIMAKSLGVHYGARAAVHLTSLVGLVDRIMGPASSLMALIVSGLLKPVGVKGRLGVPAMTEEDLKLLVEAVEEEGVIKEDEKEMIDSIFEFKGTVVRQVMVPRIDMTVINAEGTIEQLLEIIHETGHSRIPIYEENVDTIIGVIHAKDLLQVLRDPDGKRTRIRNVMRQAYYVPENKRVTELLAEFKANNIQMAIVRDEYGGTAGLVTVEDLVEEVFGEIQDEYDKEEPLLVVLSEDQALVDAKMDIGDLNDELELDIPEEEFETIGGFVFGLIGKEPEVGDSAIHEGWSYTVEEKEGRRLRKILLRRLQEAAIVDADDA